MTKTIMEHHTEIAYESLDLALFAKATNWKSYWSRALNPYIKGRVIEVGAGLGTSTKVMATKSHPRWLCLDPDPNHVSHIAQLIASGDLPPFCQAECGVLADLEADVLADTIVYVDVLEHIDDDEGELRIAAAHLEVGGQVIVLSPAFNWLYSPFDKAVGHYRRYTKSDVNRLTGSQLVLRRAFFLDSVGLFASLGNRLLLKASLPTSSQIHFWDTVLVPMSEYADGLFSAVLGKTIVFIWQRV
jgi:2-polyprenyl-3-methyl-5-hydroxy-6-metoxy-1,4-benzoquinol methylase